MTLSSIYEVPVMLEQEKFSEVVCRELGLKTPKPDLCDWMKMLDMIKTRTRSLISDLWENMSSFMTRICR